MANKTLGSVMIREIIRMKQTGFSNSKISQSLGKSITTILKYLNVIEVSGLKFKELLKLSDEDLFELFEAPNGIIVSNREPILADLHTFFPYVEKELKRVGVTRTILWKENKEKYLEGVMYS